MEFRRNYLLMLALALPGLGDAQEFGLFGHSKTVAIKRLLPAAVNLNEKKIRIEATSAVRNNSPELLTVLKTKLTTMIQRDPRFIVDDRSPETILKFVITNSYLEQKQIQCGVGNNARTIIGWTGKLEVSYQALDARNGAPLDSENLVDSITTDNKTSGGSGLSKLNVFGHHDSQSACGTGARSSMHEAQDQLIDGIVHQMAQRAAPTEELITVKLPGKKLERLSSLAMAQRWGTLEEEADKMEKLDKPQDDAYRMYLVALAKEAQAYDLARQASDREQGKRKDISAEDADSSFQRAQKLLDEARKSYQDAIQAKPGEKEFREPDNRMEQAITVYATIARHKEEYQQYVASRRGARTQQASSGDGSRGLKSGKKGLVAESGGGLNTGTAPAAGKDTPLAQIVKFCQAGVDLDTITAYVKDQAFLDDVRTSSYTYNVRTDPLTISQNCKEKAGPIQKLMRDRLASAKH